MIKDIIRAEIGLMGASKGRFTKHVRLLLRDGTTRDLVAVKTTLFDTGKIAVVDAINRRLRVE